MTNNTRLPTSDITCFYGVLYHVILYAFSTYWSHVGSSLD